MHYNCIKHAVEPNNIISHLLLYFNKNKPNVLLYIVLLKFGIKCADQTLFRPIYACGAQDFHVLMSWIKNIYVSICLNKEKPNYFNHMQGYLLAKLCGCSPIMSSYFMHSSKLKWHIVTKLLYSKKIQHYRFNNH